MPSGPGGRLECPDRPTRRSGRGRREGRAHPDHRPVVRPRHQLPSPGRAHGCPTRARTACPTYRRVLALREKALSRTRARPCTARHPPPKTCPAGEALRLPGPTPTPGSAASDGCYARVPRPSRSGAWPLWRATPPDRARGRTAGAVLLGSHRPAGVHRVRRRGAPRRGGREDHHARSRQPSGRPPPCHERQTGTVSRTATTIHLIRGAGRGWPRRGPVPAP
jgi:hypothetical protein